MGYEIIEKGIVSLSHNVASIMDTPAPTDGLRLFLGLVKYRARPIPNVAEIVNVCVFFCGRGHCSFWSNEVDASFANSKKPLRPAPYCEYLMHPFQ